MLGVFGHQQRQRGVRGLVDGAGGGQLLRLASVEILIMFVTIGLATALARTPPPQEVTTQPSNTELLIGYDLSGPPTALRLLLDWRFDLVFGTLAIALAVLYLLGVRRLRRRGDAWPVGRTVAWLAGCAVLLVATSSGIGRYSPAMFSVHMGGHMLLSMLIPVLLVLGGPVTLALRALPPAGKDGPPGPREWLLALVHSPVSRALTHPVVALVLFVGSFYVLYFSGLFGAALELALGALADERPFHPVGLRLLLAGDRRGPGAAADAAAGQARHDVRFDAVPRVLRRDPDEHADGDRGAVLPALELPWAGDLLIDQRLGGGIAWAAGEVPVLLVLVALLVQWARADEREAKRSDRRADAAGDAELAAYNAMLETVVENVAEGAAPTARGRVVHSDPGCPQIPPGPPAASVLPACWKHGRTARGGRGAMAVGETKVTLVGTVLSDLSTRKVGDGGHDVVNFWVRSNERRRDKETSEWVDGRQLTVRVTCWRQAGRASGNAWPKATR